MCMCACACECGWMWGVDSCVGELWSYHLIPYMSMLPFIGLRWSFILYIFYICLSVCPIYDSFGCLMIYLYYVRCWLKSLYTRSYVFSQWWLGSWRGWGGGAGPCGGRLAGSGVWGTGHYLLEGVVP